MSSKVELCLQRAEQFLFGGEIVEFKDHYEYQRDKKYMIRCTILSVTTLCILITCIIYVSVLHPVQYRNSTLIDIHASAIKQRSRFTPTFRMGPPPHYESLSDLNDDFLCSLRTDSAGNIASTSHSTLLSHILRLQYPQNCMDANHKYLILHHQCTVGLWASIECLSYYFLMSIFLNRTLLVTGAWTFGSDDVCTKHGSRPYENSMDCFFVPISNCSAEHVLYDEYQKPEPSVFELTLQSMRQREQEREMKINEMWFHLDPMNPYGSQGRSVHGLDERILVMPSKESGGFGWRRIFRKSIVTPINHWFSMYYNGLNLLDYLAVSKAYLLRMRQAMKRLVFRKVNETLSAMHNQTEFDGDNSLSVLLHWNDDCEHSTSLYSTCFEYTEYMQVIKELKIVQPNLQFVIVASGDYAIAQQIEEEFGAWFKQNGVAFVGVFGDLMYGERPRHAVEEILMTLQLQFASRYHLLSKAEFWEMDFFRFKESMNCAVFNGKGGNQRKASNVMIYLNGNNETHWVEWDAYLSPIFAKVRRENEELQRFSINNKLTDA